MQQQGQPADRVHPRLNALVEDLREDMRLGRQQLGDEITRIPTREYWAAEQLEAERRTLFSDYPLVVGHSSELDGAGACKRLDHLGMPLLLVRGEDGVLRCFLNVCRHRGMRLLEDEGPCRRKAIACPYHGWTYALDGRLKRIPHAEDFGAVDDIAGLTPLPCAERHGLVWVRPRPGDETLDVAGYLGGIDTELSACGLGDHVLHRRSESIRAANWKLIMDAFLEAYHIRVLHRQTLYPFFTDGNLRVERSGPHLCAAVARRGLADLGGQPTTGHNLRELVTFNHFIFPNSILIYHPDYISHISVLPEDEQSLRWRHAMLIPAAADSERAQAHWDETHALIEETVFQREDLYAAEATQAGMATGANEYLTIGRLEFPIAWFHANIRAALAGQALQPNNVDEESA